MHFGGLVMKVNEEQRRGHKAFELMVRDHPHPVLMVEPDSGKIVYASDKALVLYGWTMAELRQMAMSDLYHTDDMGTYEAQVEAERAKDKSGATFVCHKDKFGHSLPVKLTPFEINNEYSALRGYIICQMDREDCFTHTSREHEGAMGVETDSERKLILQNELKDGLKKGQFYVVYQPIVDAHDRSIAGFEALVRWCHPNLGIIYPSEILTLHFPDSFARALDIFVLNQVAQMLPVLRENQNIHVNISGLSISSQEFMREMGALIARWPLFKNKLVFDFREDLNLLSLDLVSHFLEENHIKIAVENFGSDVISLSKILDTNIHALNIDMALIKDISINYNSTVVINSILKLSKTLNINVVAKGVETPEQLRYLTKNGCRFLQGYVFAEPSSIEEAVASEKKLQEILTGHLHIEDKMRYVDEYHASEDLTLVEVDADGHIMLISEGFMKRLGYTREEMVGNSLEFFIDHADKKRYQEAFKTLKEEIYFNDCLVHFISKDNKLVYASISGHISAYGNGTPILFIEDLSHIEEETMAFKSTQTSYATIFDESPFAIMIMNEDRECIDWNRKSEQMFGWSRAEVYKKAVSKIFTNLEPVKLSQILRESLSENLFVESVNENICKDGHIITCRWHNKAIVDKQGEIRLIISMAEDITHSIQNSKLIRNLSVAMDLSAVMVVILDDSGRISNANESVVNFFGWKKEDVIGTAVQSYFNLDVKGPFIDIEGLVTRGDVWRGDLLLRRHDGDLTVCQTTVCPVKDEVTDGVNVVILLNDMSAEKEREIQLIEVKKLLSEQEKLATIGSMLTGIIHEINNPLSYIDTNMLALESILNEVDFPPETDTFEIKDIIKDIKTGVQHIKAISASLKRMAFKGLHEEVELFDVNEEIETVLNVAKNEYKYYAYVNFEREENLIINGYPSGIRQVLLNLLINSTHAIRKKFENSLGQIQIKSYREEGCVVIELTDNGTGIPESIRNSIFETFFTTKKKGEGTGLGLSISKNIVEEKHGGKLTFTSAEGEGTTFVIRIPEANE